ncbi:MGDG synthase family glycosyltransferase [Deinococcus sonorensis]|uniref:Glycosyltransferase n=2 Tax=Deinococcus sonorensis TaxID=309891 RepID=A0AAU7UDX5_9DEIO
MFSAAFGGGHTQAGRALVEALQAERPALTFHHGDFIRYLNRFQRFWTLDVYMAWLRHAPEMYRRFYEWTDQESEPRSITGTFRWLGLPGLMRDLEAAMPQLVLSSFPTNVALADTARQRLGLHFLNAIVVTDYRAHHHWARPEADLLLVASQQTRAQLLAWGVAPERVVVTGIPVGPRLRALTDADPAALRRKHGLDPDRPLLLVSSGAQGTYRALPALLDTLAQLGRPVQVLVAGGQTGAPGVEQRGGATLHRLGYTDAYPELLAAADLVVGKAGGLTVAESTVLGVPLVVYQPIPGQEEHNARFLVEHGAGLWPQDRFQLRRELNRALDPEVRARLSGAARSVGVPDAAERGAAALLSALDAGLGR